MWLRSRLLQYAVSVSPFHLSILASWHNTSANPEGASLLSIPSPPIFTPHFSCLIPPMLIHSSRTNILPSWPWIFIVLAVPLVPGSPLTTDIHMSSFWFISCSLVWFAECRHCLWHLYSLSSFCPVFYGSLWLRQILDIIFIIAPAKVVLQWI